MIITYREKLGCGIIFGNVAVIEVTWKEQRPIPPPQKEVRSTLWLLPCPTVWIDCSRNGTNSFLHRQIDDQLQRLLANCRDQIHFNTEMTKMTAVELSIPQTSTFPVRTDGYIRRMRRPRRSGNFGVRFD